MCININIHGNGDNRNKRVYLYVCMEKYKGEIFFVPIKKVWGYTGVSGWTIYAYLYIIITIVITCSIL